MQVAVIVLGNASPVPIIVDSTCISFQKKFTAKYLSFFFQNNKEQGTIYILKNWLLSLFIHLENNLYVLC